MIDLTRDVVATTIPYGQKTKLPAGSHVEITQELGGSYTVLSDIGLLRIEGADADALGIDPAKPARPREEEQAGDLTTTVTRVWNELKTCFDPEIPVNIVELGLVYENKVEAFPEGGYKVDIKMTLTAPGCGMGSILQSEAQQKILAVPGVKQCTVELVWEPPWAQAMMSEAAKLQLGMM